MEAESTGWNVALMIESQIIRIGLERMIRGLARVSTIHAYELGSLSVMLSARPNVLIVTFDEWRSLGESTEGIQSELPRLLAIGDEPYEWAGELFAALPVDGFLSLQKLSAESAEEALLRTIAGEMPMPPSLARRLLTTSKVRISGSAVRAVSLTPREAETLVLLAEGLSNKQIARRLGISIHGAKRLVGSILLKFGAPNRTGAVVAAQKAGLI